MLACTSLQSKHVKKSKGYHPSIEMYINTEETQTCAPLQAGCVYLGGDADEQQPLLLGVRAVVDDLTASQVGVALKHFLRLRVTWRGTSNPL